MKILFTILFLLILAGCTSYLGGVSEIDKKILDDPNLALKASISEILSSKVVIIKGREVVSYNYKTDILADENVITDYKGGLFSPAVLLSENGNEKTIKLYGNDTFYKDTDNKWKKIEIGATTTKNIFDNYMKVSWTDIIFGQSANAISTTTFSGSGDGFVYYDDRDGPCSTWQCTHDAEAGFVANYTGALLQTYIQYHSVIPFAIGRSFLTFPTGGLPDTSIISAATIDLYIYSTSWQDDDAQAYCAIVDGTQASNTEIVNGDYDQVGFTVFSDTKTISGINNAAYTTFTLTQAGRDNISLTENTKYGYLEGHDIEDISIDTAANKTNSCYAKSSEETGTDKDPFITIIYTEPLSVEEEIKVQDEFWFD